MSRYEREYATGWSALDRDEATERAYAIGVAEKLGEYNREELEAIYEEMDTSYNKSMVELAYREGRQEASDAASRENADGEAVWAELVEGETVVVDPDDRPMGGRDGLPEALGPSEVLDRQEVDSTDVVDRPGFLDK
jgi:hypothetical protein